MFILIRSGQVLFIFGLEALTFKQSTFTFFAFVEPSVANRKKIQMQLSSFIMKNQNFV